MQWEQRCSLLLLLQHGVSVCLSVCLLDATLSPLKATESIHGAVWVADWWAQVTDGGLDLLMRRDNFGGCPSLKCIRLYKQQMLQQSGVQCRLVHVVQSITAIAQSARLTLQPCWTFFVSREVSGVVGQSGNTGCLTLLEVLEIYWNYFSPPPRNPGNLQSLLQIAWQCLTICR